MVTSAWDRSVHQRLLSRDTSVLVELLEVLGTAVLHAAFTTTGDRQGAEDVAQAVWLDVWTRPELYDPERAALRPWLSVRAKRAGIDWTRGQARWRARERPLEGLTPDPADLTVVKAQAAAVRAALGSLPEHEQTAIRLAYFGDLTYRQVATTLHVPEGTVKSRIKAGLAQLRRSLHVPA